MGDKPSKRRGPTGRRDASSSIGQIEGLELPKRSEKRRAVYRGEQLNCLIRSGDDEVGVDVVDLSTHGLAFVDVPQRFPASWQAGQAVVLSFNEGLDSQFSVDASIKNISEVKWGGQLFKRFGLQFRMNEVKSYEAFAKALGEESVACRTAIRPQVSTFDPFFFHELTLMQVEAFSASGLEVLLSHRCKSLVPNQPLELEVYLPGRGRFLVPVVNSGLQLRDQDNRYRAFLRYVRPEPRFLEAVSEYLVMFASDATPAALRAKGFTVGDLALAFEVNYASLGDDVIELEQLRPSSLAFPEEEEQRKQGLGPFSRTLRCKLGPQLVAVMGLTFVEKGAQNSRLAAWGRVPGQEFTQVRTLEVTDLFVSSQVVLVDFLVPLMRHLVRIAVQSKSQYLMLECRKEILPFLSKIGFTPLEDQQTSRAASKRPYLLMALPVTQALLNKNEFMPQAVWRKVYEELFLYFKAQAVKQKNASQKKVR